MADRAAEPPAAASPVPVSEVQKSAARECSAEMAAPRILLSARVRRAPSGVLAPSERAAVSV
ncbi:hypothetical protein ACFQ2H_03580 [Streptomyces violaceoruber]